MDPGILDPRITFTRASLGTYTNASGIIQAAAANAPRWDFVNGVLRGVLMEEPRTNIIPSSEDFTAGWSQAGATLAAGPVSPNGSSLTTRMVEDTSNAAHYSGSATASYTPSATYTFSVYAKMQQVRYLQLSIREGAGNGGHATFDLQTGTVSGPPAADGTGVVGAAFILPIGGGTYRCGITSSIGASVNGALYLFMSNAPNPGWAPSYAGNASNGLLVWGSVCEKGSFATSYIPSAGAAATRAGDFATMPTNPSWYNQPASTLLSESIHLTTAAVNGHEAIAVLDNGSSNARVEIYRVGTSVNVQNLMYVAGSLTYGPTMGPIVPGAVIKAAMAWRSGYQLSALNGVTAGADTQATIPTAATVLNFGGVDGGIIINGYMRRVGYWNSALPAGGLQQMTT
jgi:hypothetical protein